MASSLYIQCIVAFLVAYGVNCAHLSVNETNSSAKDNEILSDFEQISFEIFEDFIRSTMKPGEYGSLCRKKIIEQTRYCYDENKSSKETMDFFCSSNCDIINCIQNKVERFCSLQAKRIYSQQRDEFYSTISEKKCLGEFEICKESSFFSSALGIGVTITVITGSIAIICLIGAFFGYRYRMKREN
uniref:Uncharacterized protein n=1 Tax=Tetranychus urticae TaxID=32264 RepID=T1KQB3_TETUR